MRRANRSPVRSPRADHRLLGVSEGTIEGTEVGWTATIGLPQQSQLFARLHARTDRGRLSGGCLVSLVHSGSSRTNYSGTSHPRATADRLRLCEKSDVVPVPSFRKAGLRPAVERLYLSLLAAVRNQTVKEIPPTELATTERSLGQSNFMGDFSMDRTRGWEFPPINSERPLIKTSRTKFMGVAN